MKRLCRMLFSLLLSLSLCAGKHPARSVPKGGFQAKRNRLIVIDPGHGGEDRGAVAPSVREKTLTLSTAFLLKRYLRGMGYPVVLTRSRDLFLPLKMRVSITRGMRSRIFVSLHYNAFRKETVEGVEVYYYGKGPSKRIKASKRLAGCILSRILFHTKAVSRGTKHGNFHVIRETGIPAVLVEGGFITHPGERKRLTDPRYVHRLVRGIAEGIALYFGEGSGDRPPL
ncbi:MAG: N-acetylmuramoyl-L-alanine amidase [Simkaniaceae bacterium]|nr:N-acetylmuramoyl-L-alanine amidase [Simkaniaceae bacterium]